MDHTKILKRAWHILWQYRVLWLFGFILALTTASYGSSGTSYNVGSRDFERDRSGYQLEELDPETQKGMGEFVEGLVDFFENGIPSDISNTLIVVGIIVGFIILALVIIGKILRYLSETALIRLVDEYEETEEKRSIRYGFGLGWSKRSWRLFLIDLVVGIPVFMAFSLFLVLLLLPLLLWVSGEPVLGGIGTIASIGMFFLFIFFAIFVGVVLNFLMQFFRRACVIDDLGVFESIKHGFALIKENFKNAGIMWLIMAGISIGWSMVMIPVSIMVVLAGGLIAAAAALAVAGVVGLFQGGPEQWIFAIAIGAPIFIVLVSFPLAFINGLRETFVSSTWTLTYRELASLEPASLKELPDPSPPEDEISIEETEEDTE